MLTRVLFALLSVVLAVPVSAACPTQKTPSHDCCHKTSNCPKPAPVKVEPCFDCVADVRTTAVMAEHATQAAIPVSPQHHLSFAVLSVTPAKYRGPLTDNSSTYLRIGVLRI